MAGKPKKTPRWYEEQMERSRRFRELLRRRVELDQKLAAERERRAHG
jgi:hypothetical protein